MIDKAEGVGLSSEPSEVVPRKNCSAAKDPGRGLMWCCGAAPRRGNETKDPTERSSVRTPLRARCPPVVAFRQRQRLREPRQNLPCTFESAV